MTIKYIIELENGKFADVTYEGGTHIYIRSVSDFTKATMYKNLDNLNEIYNEMVKFNEVGFGFDPHHCEWQFGGECIVPKDKKEVKFILGSFNDDYHKPPKENRPQGIIISENFKRIF